MDNVQLVMVVDGYTTINGFNFSILFYSDTNAPRTG